MRRRPQRFQADLLEVVERMFLREILTFEGERHVGLRLEGAFPDRSVFAVARLDGGSTIAVARVYEADLEHDPAQALRLVYMTEEDLGLFCGVVGPIERQA